MTYLLDTNVILRYLLDDHEELSTKAKQLFKEVAENMKRVEIPAFVLIECVHVLSKFYRVPRTEIADRLMKLLSFAGIINPDREQLINALLHYRLTNIDMVDCLLAAMSSPHRQIISFDTDFDRIPNHRALI